MRTSAWERIFDALADPVLVLDPAGVAVRLSGRLRALLARPHDAGVGVHWQALLEPWGEPDAWPIALALADGETRVAEQSLPPPTA